MRKILFIMIALAAGSLILNWLWVNLPLSVLGVSGRQAIIYGRITLFQTFLYPHPYIIPWASGFLLNILHILLLVSSRRRHSLLSVIIPFSSGLSTMMLWLLIMHRWNFSMMLAPMYTLGLPAATIPLFEGLLTAVGRLGSRR